MSGKDMYVEEVNSAATTSDFHNLNKPGHIKCRLIAKVNI